MKTVISFCILLLVVSFAFSQSPKTELYDLVKKLIADSTEYPSPSQWAVGEPSMYPVKWQEDRVIMSDDIKINFFRKGTTMLTVNGVGPAKGSVMIRGPRSGFNSFNILFSVNGKPTIDNLFAKKIYTSKLLQSCNTSSPTGFYYYQLLLPKKVLSFLKLAWSCQGDNCTVSLDCYDDWSKQYAELTCPRN